MSYGVTNPCLHHVWYLKCLRLLFVLVKSLCSDIREFISLVWITLTPSTGGPLTIGKNFEIHKQTFAIYFI